MKIVVIDQSTLVPPKEFLAMVKAVAMQLTDHVAPAWGKTPPSFEPLGKGMPVPVNSAGGVYPIYIFDNADTADALGYHDETPGGLIYGRVFAKPVLGSGGSLLRGSNSVSAVLSHEGAELLCDPYCNFWVDGPGSLGGSGTARTWALEVCDPVQGQAYDLAVGTGTADSEMVSVSNFILPAWLDPHGKGPYDWMKVCTRPFQIARDGYAIVRRGGPGTEKNVFGRWLGKHKDPVAKSHPAARSARRMG